jgi:hypothetical protein
LHRFRLRWPRRRKLMRGGQDPRELQRLSVESRLRRARRAQESAPAVSSSAGEVGEFPQGRPERDSSPLHSGPHTPPVHPETNVAKTSAERTRERQAAHLAAKPARSPVTPEEAHYAPYASLGSLESRLGCPAEDESHADWSIRRQLVMDTIWERKLRHNGTLEIPTMPRFFPNPEQWYMR